MSQENISNTVLIDNLYDSAGEHLRNTVTDWTNHELWSDAVDELDANERAVYLIGVLNQQVMNGGFIQYFDNSYGMFGYETLRVLRTVGAVNSANLLELALKIVNREQLTPDQFSKYIATNIVADELGDELDQLDEQYYKLENTEYLEELLANWIKTEPNKRWQAYKSKT
ncbi:DUF4375 domain-containing protein [Fulvivirga sp. RKSG066]|uniref:DMP19 family protein n=1 Tax=Fulvivirga aurantia TaxID=2529383 RepID=UPI0012BC5B67|nr:DUF4375 domain-containing protein [Fulvivirga aurantia]MTI22763.1 DUF4375 domain-containing protein [Fulvivirga aurantia]